MAALLGFILPIAQLLASGMATLTGMEWDEHGYRYEYSSE